MSKYDPLRDHLATAGGPVEMSFSEIDELVGGLPDSARQYRAWWSNTHYHADAWTATGRVVEQVNLTAERVRFSAPGLASQVSTQQESDDPEPDRQPVDWPQVWPAVAHTLTQHLEHGLAHLLTEDVLRFATIRALVDVDVDPRRIRVEHRAPEISASIDLVVDSPPSAVVELKFPRDPTMFGAADTMTLGEMLRDFYRLAWLDLEHAYALQIVDTRLAGYLGRRSELSWTWTPGESMVMPSTLPSSLPATARASLPVWTADFDVRADCTAAFETGDLRMAVYRVAQT